MTKHTFYLKISVPKWLGNTEPATMSQARNWTFTLNNPSQQEVDELKLEKPEVQYIVFQKEKTSTEHIQGYVQFRLRQRLASVKRILNCPRAHLEAARGDANSNIAYCTKAETRIEEPFHMGEPVQQGQRTDLSAFNLGIINGLNDKQLIELHMNCFYRYSRVVDRVRSAYREPRNWLMTNKVFWGPSGSGKTRRALEEAGTDFYFVSKGDTNQSTWWDGYCGQQTVIIDDFYGWLPWSFMLRLLDRYPFNVQFKGGSIPFTSKTIIITSNTAPDTWYRNIPNNDMTPLLRRITEIINLL